MSKVILGLIIAVVLMLPAVVLAEQVDRHYKVPKTIYEFAPGCSDHTTATSNETCGRVSVFDDQDNKCYVAWNVQNTSSSISCVKE